MICTSTPYPEYNQILSFCFGGGDSEPDHDGGHGSDGDGNWDGK